MNVDDRSENLRRRIFAVDLLRGFVMMIMLLDHTRDFIHAGALQSDPTDPATTTVAVFFTRWITHFCAPAFVFLSGVSIYLQKLNGKSNAELSRFLWTRGLWLVFLEFTVIRFLITFNLDYSFFGMAQVIWVIGLSMIVMAALVYLPAKVVGVAGLGMILLHNLLDGFQIPPQIAFMGAPPPSFWQSIWLVLHQMGVIPLFGGSVQIFLAYPLIPWVGVMMAGYALGTVYSWEGDRRRKLLLRLGLAATVLFVLVRFINIYGDPVPWTTQIAQPSATSDAAAGGNSPLPPGPEQTVAPPPRRGAPVFAFLSFLNTTKYPPSLLFLLMTLGPSLILVAVADTIKGNSRWQRISITFGRVPLFFYILQWAWAHGAALVVSYLAGKDTSYLFLSLSEMGQKAPPGYGFSLPVVYAVWIGGLIMIYPLCAWYAGVKRRNKHWLLSYL